MSYRPPPSRTSKPPTLLSGQAGVTLPPTVGTESISGPQPVQPSYGIDWSSATELTPTAERPTERLAVPTYLLQPTLCIIGSDMRVQIEVPVHGRMSIGRDAENE